MRSVSRFGIVAIITVALAVGQVPMTIRAQEATPVAGCQVTTPAENEELDRAFYDADWIGGNVDDADRFLADDYTITSEGRPHANTPGNTGEIERFRELKSPKSGLPRTIFPCPASSGSSPMRSSPRRMSRPWRRRRRSGSARADACGILAYHRVFLHPAPDCAGSSGHPFSRKGQYRDAGQSSAAACMAASAASAVGRSAA